MNYLHGFFRGKAIRLDLKTTDNGKFISILLKTFLLGVELYTLHLGSGFHYQFLSQSIRETVGRALILNRSAIEPGVREVSLASFFSV